MTPDTVALVAAPVVLPVLLAGKTYISLRAGDWRPVAATSAATVLLIAGLFVGGGTGLGLTVAGLVAVAFDLVAVVRSTRATRAEQRQRLRARDAAAYAQQMAEVQRRLGGIRRWN